jgi:cation:H+ antiporter
MFIPILLFAVGIVLLIKGGDWFVDGASGIAHRFHIPEILIGATVVSIGTTLPEVMVSASGAMSGSGSMAYGNAIGSIICNTSLIAALTVAIRPAGVNKKSLRFPVFFFFGAAAVYAFIAYFFQEFARWAGIVLLCGFLAYMTVLVIQAIKEMRPKPSEVSKEFVADVIDDEVSEEDQGKSGDYLGFLIVGGALLIAQTVAIVTGGGLMTDISDIVAFFGFYLSGILGIILSVIGVSKVFISGKLKSILNSNVLFIILGAAVNLRLHQVTHSPQFLIRHGSHIQDLRRRGTGQQERPCQKNQQDLSQHISFSLSQRCAHLMQTAARRPW